MKNEKNFINEIHRRNFDFKYIEQSLTQSNLLETVSKDIYPDPKRFILEMLQNCDDSSFNHNCGKLEMTINLFKQSLIISHKGKPFDENDIRSICSAGASTKVKNEKATGYKGIGFKSIFQHSNKVIIISNNYQFRFDKDYFNEEEKNWQNDWGSYDEWKEMEENKKSNKIKKPWQIIPIWTDNMEIDKNYLSVIKDFPVNFIIYFNSIDSFNVCKCFLLEIEDDNTYLLFLKSKEINLILREHNSILKKFCN